MSESKTEQKTDNPEPVKLPSWQEAMIYDYVHTIDQLLLLGLSPRVHKLVKGRVERMKANGIRVPEDYENLKDAVKLVKTGFIDTGLFYGDGTKGSSRLVGNFSKIVVGAGVHEIDGDYLRISSAVDIVGDPKVEKEDIVIKGGILIMEGIQGCHLQHLTLCEAKDCGVWGGSFFTMDDVLVKQCGLGVKAVGTVVGRLTNVEVRDCGWSGVVASFGASITLVGDKTTVHGNCTKGMRDDYGLKVFRSSSTIQLVSPLTKETVSVNNSGGGNWGAVFGADINEIKNIEAPSDTSDTSETKNNTLRFF